MSDQRLPRRRWREAGRRVARAAAAGFLLACSVGLFYVGVLAWESAGTAPGELRSGPRGLPLFALGATVAGIGAVFLKGAVQLRTRDDERAQ